MKLRHIRILRYALTAALLLMLFLFYVTERIPFLVTGLILTAACFLVYLLLWRCPHCGGWLGRFEPEYCPHCGKKLRL